MTTGATRKPTLRDTAPGTIEESPGTRGAGAKAVKSEITEEDVDMAAAVKGEPEDLDQGSTVEATPEEDINMASAVKEKPKDLDQGGTIKATPEEDINMASAVKEKPKDLDQGSTTEATTSVASDNEDVADDDEDEDEDMDKLQSQLVREPAPPKKQGQPPPPRALPFQRKKPATANE